MQDFIAEESNLHERALQAVKSVSTPGKDEPETKEIIADVLRGFLLLENAKLTGSEQVFVFGVAGKSYAYNHIANALREQLGQRRPSQETRLCCHSNCKAAILQVVYTGQKKERRLARDGLRLRRRTGTMDIRMVRYRRIRRRISS